MKKGKESWTLLWVWTAYLQAKEIKWEFYVKVSDFNRCMDSIRIEQEADRKHIEQLEKENKQLREEMINKKHEILDFIKENKVKRYRVTLSENYDEEISLDEDDIDSLERIVKNEYDYENK